MYCYLGICIWVYVLETYNFNPVPQFLFQPSFQEIVFLENSRICPSYKTWGSVAIRCMSVQCCIDPPNLCGYVQDCIDVQDSIDEQSLGKLSLLSLLGLFTVYYTGEEFVSSENAVCGSIDN